MEEFRRSSGDDHSRDNNNDEDEDEDSEVGDGCNNGACHAIRKSLWILSTINY